MMSVWLRNEQLIAQSIFVSKTTNVDLKAEQGWVGISEFGLGTVRTLG